MAWAEALDAEVVYHDPPELPDATTHRGRAAYLDLKRATEELVTEMSYEVRELRDFGDRVLTVMRLAGRAHESPIPVEMEVTWVTRWRDGRIVEVHTYLERASALAALEQSA